MILLAKKIKRKAFWILKMFWAVNWIKTIYFNFKMLPIEQAKKLPVVFYGKVLFTGLNGKIEIDNAILKFGLVKIGHNLEIISGYERGTELKVNGTLKIMGSFMVGLDTTIIIASSGTLSIGEGSYLGRNTKIICTNKIVLGKQFRFGYDSQVSDSNYHYTYDLSKGIIGNINGEVFIDDYCWVGNRCTIMKGTKTPKFFIIGANSLLNKNYTDIPEKSLIAGSPAKLVRTDIVRVFDSETEGVIADFFSKNPDTNLMKPTNTLKYFS
jgi:acetyltransferase-like isoleucine patch superfamily enzyme